MLVARFHRRGLLSLQNPETPNAMPEPRKPSIPKTLNPKSLKPKTLKPSRGRRKKEFKKTKPKT